MIKWVFLNFLEDRLNETKKVEENKIFIKYNEERLVKKYECGNFDSLILPKGNYLTMYYDDSYKNNFKYYKMMADYINKHNIKTIGKFN